MKRRGSASCTLPLLPVSVTFTLLLSAHATWGLSLPYGHADMSSHPPPSEAFQRQACQVFLHSLCMYIPPTPSNLPALLLCNKAPTAKCPLQSKLNPHTGRALYLERLCVSHVLSMRSRAQLQAQGLL